MRGGLPAPNNLSGERIVTSIEVHPNGEVIVDSARRVETFRFADGRLLISVDDGDEWDDEDVIHVTELIDPIGGELAERFAERGAL